MSSILTGCTKLWWGAGVDKQAGLENHAPLKRHEGSNPSPTAKENIMIDKKLVLVSGAIVFKETRGKKRWFLIKKEEEGSEWEIPKIMARKTESSARAAIRLMAEQASMDAKVLEEAGRAGGSTTVNGKAVPQRYLYYLMVLQGGGEILGFDEFG